MYERAVEVTGVNIHSRSSVIWKYSTQTSEYTRVTSHNKGNNQHSDLAVID